ncbi:MAG: FlgD immunoglobulin-like domain containing protein, partial [Calditrichia bacterium]
VNVSAADFANPPNVMRYSYKFRIEVEALAVEVQSQNTIRNGTMQLSGSWQLDPDEVVLPGLTNGARLMAVDNDGSHIVRVYPFVSEEGDYNIMMASSSKFLGESARYRFVNSAGAVNPHFAEYNRIFYNQWHRLSPTPVHFTTDSLANGYIELSGLSDIETRQILDAFRLEKIDRLDPPTIPTMKWVKITNPAINEIEVAWYPSLEGDIAGYRLFMSDDGLTWNTPLVDETVLDGNTFSYTLTYSAGDPTVYFRVVAVDTNTFVDEYGNEEPLLSPPGDAYGVGLGSNQNILIVDNFDRMASWTHPQHPFVANHGEALAANGQGFESCTETAVQNGEIDLSAYDMVIYFCGDDSRSDESLAAADQFRLLDYLEAGGKLFISGSEIGYDFDDTTPTELARYQYLLRARYVGDLSGSNRVLGQAGTVFDGLDFIYGTMTGPDLYIEDYPDYLNTYSGSEVALFYGNLRIAGVQFTGTYGNSSETAQLVYLGFTFETIITPQDRAALMGRVLDYFGLPTAIADNEAVLTEQFRLAQNYPNPFNPSTKIQYTIPADKSQARVKLEIFNTLGQKLATLVDEKQAAGSYEVEWDGRSANGLPAASGIYYYRITVADLVATRKMLLVR